jgi:hypothetical protein
MKDFKERLEAVFVRGLYFHEKDATVKITEIKDRYPFPLDENEARSCPGAYNVFSDRHKNQTYYAIQVFYSETYKKKYETRGLAHPVAQTCNVILRTVGLGAVTIADCESDVDKLEFPLLKTENAYRHLPPVD